MRLLYRMTVAAVLGSLCAALVAAPKPIKLSPIFDDGAKSELKLPKRVKPCNLLVARLSDERGSPELIGVYFGRAIHAPDDREAWIRSMIAALGSRKIKVSFTASAEEQSVGLRGEIAVTKAWIANTDSNMSTSIVFRLKVTGAEGTVTEQSYRGGASHMSYWSGGPGELQRAFDTGVSRGLDAMAADLHKICDGGSIGAEAS